MVVAWDIEAVSLSLHTLTAGVPFQVLELLLMRWPGEAAALLQESLLRVLALALSGRETSLVVAGVYLRDAASMPIASIGLHRSHSSVTHASVCAAPQHATNGRCCGAVNDHANGLPFQAPPFALQALCPSLHGCCSTTQRHSCICSAQPQGTQTLQVQLQRQPPPPPAAAAAAAAQIQRRRCCWRC